MSISDLFPVLHFQHGFTTCPDIKLNNVINVPLNDSQLGVHKINSRTTHALVTPPPPSSHEYRPLSLPLPNLAWEALYPKDSINPSASIPGGFGFYMSGPLAFAEDLKNAKEAVMSWRMMLGQGWEWAKGGKLPGVFGGVGDSSYRCTGGRQEDRCKCLNLRLMWRAKSAGELYTYLPLVPTNTTRLLAVPPLSKQNNDHGFSVGRGAFTLDVSVGRWVSIALRVKLNEVGSEDGEVEVWLDGTSVIVAKGLVLRDSKESKIKGLHFQTFFGGHTDDWASPNDQRAWFADVSGVVVS